jgi:hypothetical protein
LTRLTNEPLLRQLTREKVHIEPETLRLSPPSVQRHYAHAWAPVQQMVRLLRPCPQELLRWWADTPRGHLLITHLPSRYAEGSHELRNETVENVARVCLVDLHRDPQVALHPVASLLDHLMGSHGTPKGEWLSDGAGVVPELEEAGATVREYAALGYVEELAEAPGPRGYFAVAFAIYLTEPERLNVMDPRMYRLLRSSILSEPFWNRIAPSLPSA